MSNWSSRTLPYISGHQRSASVVGYNNDMYSDNEPPKYDQSWMYRMKGPYYNSSMDVSKVKQNSQDYNKSDWGYSAQYQPSSSVSTYLESPGYSQKQRPFEAAFKSAIIKMKESGLSRLGTVDKNIPGVSIMKTNFHNDTDELYTRNCQTLQPSRKYNTEETAKQVFRCQSSASRPNVYSVSKVSKDFISDTEKDINLMRDQYKSQTDLVDDSKRNTSFSSMSNVKYSSQDRGTNTGNSVIIPAKDNKVINVSKDQNSVKTEAYISPHFTKSMQSSLSQSFHNNNDDADNSLNFESLPSVKEIISKVEALSNQSEKHVMSSPLKMTHDKPPILLSQRTGNQRPLDNYQNPISQMEPQTSANKRLSGMYKKNASSPSKVKSLSNMPSDFQKLHLAFLDQKQENQRLRQEIIEKNAVINQLETELKNYEPWR